uniref:Sodium channel protein type 1 subunit alpha n=1 Tax=Zeugodacus cucurbitae TaxID=28588 RepID=A0A0A1X7I0_ZEUCU
MLNLTKTSMDRKTSVEWLDGSITPKFSQKRLQAARSLRRMMNSDLLGQSSGVQDEQPKTSSQNSQSEDAQSKRRVHFDFVGNGTDPRTRNEMFALTQELLENRKNCCLQRFCNKRLCPLFFLHQLVVRNVERRLQLMQCKLINIHLCYYDLRQHPITGHFFHLLRSDMSFSTTHQLFKWLDSQYRRLFGVGQWHEIIEVMYEFEDQRYMIHKVNLVIMHLYLHKLDVNSKRSLCRLLRTPSPPIKRTPMKRGVADERSMLINDCISAHFAGGEPWWILFDVSLDRGQITGDMLKLAHSAYMGMKEELKKLNNVNNDSSDASDRLKGGTVPNNPLDTKKSPQTRSALQRKLYAWTERFEKSFERIYRALQQYYDCKYAEGVAQLCHNVCQKSNQTDRKELLGENKQPQSSMQYYFNRYKLAQVSLENLLRELEFCEYKNNLVPYLRRKAKELNENAAKYKVLKLKVCKTQLADAIKDEILAVRNN